MSHRNFYGNIDLRQWNHTEIIQNILEIAYLKPIKTF